MNDKALYIVKTLVEHGYQAVCAGGYVRDRLLGLEPHDIDIATSATPDQIESLFTKTLAIGKAFGVILVVVDGNEFEVATFRSDGESTDGRHPDSIRFCSMEEDARRRDLTINGMFYDPLADKIIDYVGGQTDLEHNVVRLIGNPLDRINEDKLRLLRVVRFAARFDFTIESETAAAVCLKAQEITQVSAERIANELSKILKTKNKRRAIELLFESHLIYSVLPDIAKMKGVEQPPEFHPEGARVRRICIGLGPFEKLDLNNPEHFDPTKYKMYPGDVLEHTTLTLEKLPEDASIELLWGGLLHDVGKPYTQTFEDRIRFSGHDAVGETKAIEILKGFKFSNVFVEHVASLVKNHMKMAAAERMRTSKLKRFVNLPKFEEHLALHRADCAASHGGFEHWEFLQNKLKEFESMPEKVILDKLPRLVTGHDLIDLGFKQGPVFRTILEAIQDLQLENVITTKEQAINHILTTYAGESNAGNSSSLEKAGC